MISKSQPFVFTGVAAYFSVDRLQRTSDRPVQTLIAGYEDLGNWDVHRAKELATDDRVMWSVELPMQPQMQFEYKYVRISKCSGGELWARWECGANRIFVGVLYSNSYVINDVERGFQDWQPLQLDPNGDDSTDSMVPNSGNEELHSDLVCFVNLSRCLTSWCLHSMVIVSNYITAMPCRTITMT